MIKATCNLLVFDEVDRNKNLFPKDMDITLPDICPVLSGNPWGKAYACLGKGVVKREEDRLILDISFFPESGLDDTLRSLMVDNKIYIAGYYSSVKSHEKDGIRIVESMRLDSAFITFADVYGNNELIIKLKED